MLNKLSPFFAIICSFFVLKEVAGKLDWVTVIAAFVGMLLVVKPTMSMETVPALIGALGGFGAGFAYTFVRKLGQRGENSMIIVLFFSAFSCAVTLPFFVFQYQPMSGLQWLFLICTGISAAGGQIFITKAEYCQWKSQLIVEIPLGFQCTVFFLQHRGDHLFCAGLSNASCDSHNRNIKLLQIKLRNVFYCLKGGAYLDIRMIRPFKSSLG